MYTENKKKPLPTGWYHATCRGVQWEDQIGQVLWTVDRGEYAWQNVTCPIHPNNPKTLDHLRGLMGSLNMNLPDDPHDELFDIALRGTRGQLNITQRIDDTQGMLIKYNFVMEAYPAAYPAEVNVLKEINNIHILQAPQYGAAKLPIKPQKINS